MTCIISYVSLHLLYNSSSNSNNCKRAFTQALNRCFIDKSYLEVEKKIFTVRKVLCVIVTINDALESEFERCGKPPTTRLNTTYVAVQNFPLHHLPW